jgi:hypothetical protein
MKDFKRVFVAGKVKGWHNRSGAEMLLPLWITVKWETKKSGKPCLSITGVHGPMNDGDAHGSSGQCDETLEELVNGPQENISEFLRDGKADRLLNIWRKYHLNDMNADCEHMVRDHGWDLKKELTIFKWKLSRETSSQQRKLGQATKEILMRGGAVQYTEEQLTLLHKEYWAYTETEIPPGPDYSLEGKTISRATQFWYKPKNENYPAKESVHSEGLLTKPCPTCGHTYGGNWQYRGVPEDVLEFLAAIPDNASKHPWGKEG